MPNLGLLRILLGFQESENLQPQVVIIYKCHLGQLLVVVVIGDDGVRQRRKSAHTVCNR